MCCYFNTAFWIDNITRISSALWKWNRLYMANWTSLRTIDINKFSCFWFLWLVRCFVIFHQNSIIHCLYCFSNDKLTIYDGGSKTSGIIGEYCDSMPPFIITTSNEVFVRFYTSEVYTGTGFKMKYNSTSRLKSTQILKVYWNCSTSTLDLSYFAIFPLS